MRRLKAWWCTRLAAGIARTGPVGAVTARPGVTAEDAEYWAQDSSTAAGNVHYTARHRRRRHG